VTSIRRLLLTTTVALALFGGLWRVSPSPVTAVVALGAFAAWVSACWLALGSLVGGDRS
jgi:hypothetical protein